MTRHLWKRHRTLFLCFLVAVGLMLFFGGRAVMFSLRWDAEALRTQPLAGWMTPRLVSYAHDLPPEVLLPMLGLDPDATPRRMTLEEIAKAQGIPTDRFLAELAARIADRGDYR